MADIFSYELKGMNKLLAMTNPARFEAALRKRMRIATELNGKVTERYQRQLLQDASGRLTKNAPLTVAIKHSSKPLVHSGELFQGIQTIVIDDFTSFTGVSRQSRGFDIIDAITEGARVPVTPKMRGMFMALYRASQGELDPSKLEGRAAELWKTNQVWFPLSPDTDFIVIPPRPWHKRATQMSGYREAIRSNWKMALQQTFADLRVQE